MLPWSFSEEAAAEKYMPQLQHNMWVVAARSAVLSVITGGGKWVEIKPTPIRSTSTSSSPPRGSSGVASRMASRRAVRRRAAAPAHRGDPHRRHELVECLGGILRHLRARTRAAHLEHEQAKAELKSLMPEDAKEAIGHGVRAKRSKSGAVSFDLLRAEASHAPVQ
jgi:hypothetical protein